MAQFFYIHGGPGLNSRPESQILKEVFENQDHEIFFFNEPSILRKNEILSPNPFENYLLELENKFLQFLEESEEPVSIIAHSFGVYGAHYLIKKFGSEIGHLFLVAPAFDLNAVDSNLINLSISDFLNLDQEKAKTLIALNQERAGNFDQKTLEALFVVASNPHYTDHYFVNLNTKTHYYSHMVEEFAFDLESFLGVRNSLNANLVSHSKVQIPCTVFIGENEKITSSQNEIARLETLFDLLDIQMISDVGHYPHLEKSTAFLNLINHKLNYHNLKFEKGNSYVSPIA
jgi:pimeloyl-ACP methyl ester carboxylesterase